MKRVLIIGGGASGMIAAVTAADHGAQVTIYEKNDRIGKKILATGNGKCNLSNRKMDPENYYSKDKEKLFRMFARFSVDDTIRFFEKNGLMIRDKEGYLYPYCEQASALLDVLLYALLKKQIIIETNVSDIMLTVKKNGKFTVHSSVGKKEFDSVILACGSNAGIKNETEGYTYAKLFGHRILPVLPALVQVRCEENYFKAIAGVRAKAKISLYENETVIAQEYGELQLTDYGISGIPVFQFSRMISLGLYQKKSLKVVIDFLPEIQSEEWNRYAEERLTDYRGMTCEEFLTGILNKKISLLLLALVGLKPSDVIDTQNSDVLKSLCTTMKTFAVTPKAVNPLLQAQVCCGGVDFAELDDNLESVYQPGLFMCGEMIDIDGKCGGYNLQWAWTSGYIAGVSASENK